MKRQMHRIVCVTVAASFMLAATACSSGSASLSRDDMFYSSTVERAEYIAEFADDLGGSQALLEGFALCDELAGLAASGTDLASLPQDEQARLWRRIAWPYIEAGTVALPGGESDFSARLPARSALCPVLAAQLPPVTSTGDIDAPHFPEPSAEPVDEVTASRRAEIACAALPESPTAQGVIAAARGAADELPDDHVYAWMYDHCSGKVDAARTTR